MGLLEAGEHSTLKKALNRFVAGGLTVLVLAVVYAMFTLFNLDHLVDQLELKSYDLRAQIQLGESQKKPSSDIVILQFDDPSLKVLSDEYGEWPWPRDVHAQMIDFLNRAGTKRLLYDIMFVAARKGGEAGDEKLAEAFRRHKNVYLSMNLDNELDESQKLGKDLTPKDIERLKPFTIRLKMEFKPNQRSFLKLKRYPDGTLFFDNDHMTFNHYRSIMPQLLETGRNIAIINHGVDEDGVSRGNPLFFRFQYQAFLKTQHLPLKQAGKNWMDSQGRRTDADGYMFARSQALPVVPQKDGKYLDRDPRVPQSVDGEGYLLDAYGHMMYQRETRLSTMYFPYLGLKALLDLKFPNKTPDLLLTRDGHLKFPGYDIPLRTNGDFLVNWYNVNTKWEDYKSNLRDLSTFRESTLGRITTLEAQQTELKNNAASSKQDLLKVQNALAAQRADLKKADELTQLFEGGLQGGYFPQPYQVVSAWEVIRTMQKERAGLPLGADDLELKARLKNKIVFLGATAIAAYDIKNTPIYSTMPGVVVQASLFDNLYQNKGRYLHSLAPSANFLITVLICLLAAGCTFKMRSGLAGLLTNANIAVLYVLAALLLFQQAQIWINIALPLMALVITTIITFMLKYFWKDQDYEKTYALATTDSMTGLYNHRFFQDHMRRSIDQASRFKHKFSLVLIDIDFFKKFNDTHGHQAGDEVLRHVARKLQKVVRTVDMVARYGGEEMAIVLDRANEEEALAVAQKVVQAIAEEAYPIAQGVMKHVTISCGVATYPSHGEEPSQLIEFADAGLYRAKENGRNQVGAQYDDPDKPKSDVNSLGHGH